MISRECFQIGGHRWNERWPSAPPWRNCFEELVSACTFGIPGAGDPQETRRFHVHSEIDPRLRDTLRCYAECEWLAMRE